MPIHFPYLPDELYASDIKRGALALRDFFSSNIFIDFFGFFCWILPYSGRSQIPGPKKLSGPSLLNQHYNRLELVSCDALMLIPKSRGLFANCVQIATLEVTR